MTYDDEPREHECPRPLEEQVDEFDVGGMFLSPAGRWETIIDRTPHAERSARIVVHSSQAGREYCWTFWRSDKLPYLPAWQASQPRHVVVHETAHTLGVDVTAYPRSYTGGYSLLSAQQVRGTGWVITDVPDGKTVEYVTLPSKARARSEVTRRARAHAKRLGVPVWREPGEVTR
jgi:hypothetical protein